MGAASRREGAPTAFLWGINGAMSVVASVVGALFAMFFGINFTFTSGFVAYAVAAAALVLIVRSAVRGDGAETPEGDGADDGRIVTEVEAKVLTPASGGNGTSDDEAPGEREPALEK